MTSHAKKNIILLFKKFQHDLGGWCDVSISTFKSVIAPNRDKLEWSAANSKIIGEIISLGGAYALRSFYKDAKGNKPLIALLKENGIGENPAPESMPRAELDSHMKALIKKCKKDNWDNKQFESFLVYLESDLGVDDLKRAKVYEQKRDDGDITAVKPQDDKKEDDQFAAMYRSGSEVFRRAVREHLIGALK